MDRDKMKSYDNFNVAIYCPVENINDINDFDEFNKRFQLIERNIKISKVYLECYRGGSWIEEDQLRNVKKFFEDKGIKASGGITPNAEGLSEGFASMCYTNQKSKDVLQKAVTLLARVFDEFIIDDFFFFNCRCDECIKAKGGDTWSNFRLSLMKKISKDIIMKKAKEVNPNVNVIIKFPNWYEAFQETGYNLKDQANIFDEIYTGTETRNPSYAQQALPKYLSYFNMRYLENVAPSRNMGGWFDPYECTYNLSSYLEQGYLTLYSKCKEVTLFCLDSLIKDSDYEIFPAAAGQIFSEVDGYIGRLGNPIGVSAYLPYNSSGEDNIHNYLGMCGIPFEPSPIYPKDEKVVFLAEGSACDKDIISKMKESLRSGADIIVTSGFIRKLDGKFEDFMNISYSSRKALVREYGYSTNNGINIKANIDKKKKVLIPQVDYFTNDVWELAAAYSNANNFPLILRGKYSNGRIWVITIPDNLGDLYFYPKEILGMMRSAFCSHMPCWLIGNSQVAIFLYDNDTMILRSDLPYVEEVSLKFHKDIKEVTDIKRGKDFKIFDSNTINLTLSPCVNYILKVQYSK